MLTKRIIPCLDVNNGRVVKGKKFQNLIDVDDPVKLAKYYSAEGADELVFYDITASNEGRNIFLHLVEQTAEEVNIPFTVGGGIRGIQDFHDVLRAGADKVSVNSAAVMNPEIITEAALKYGRQCVVLSIDAKKNLQGQWNVYINGGRVDTKLDALEWAVKGEMLGAGEIVINSIDTDGIKDGYEIELTKSISEVVSIPVVASGGAGKREDFYKVLTEGKADAALAASVFHYGEIKIYDLKDYLYSSRVPIRRTE
ncbi:imidazole glycerol phosphate synthase subunit hisF [Geosporobacter subterraneus DSM 17957]|uniref:Imidazole glycerol phosphate synthase subunit HisF n=1 Tax=Geosporobacter subterraneus DSM 17957 TaxID=1121919 RepID=A0A1M6JYE6_9FIRM|nr:imidazole glycerol phosphate synthase subunit HisF [Geosporobacter subterraneus]SHJ51693.1 imidazole glycerol phosphate synthase subunit hisF [Geosporobacter subterraneus DSM 17957]